MKKFLFLATVVGAAFTSCVNDNEAVLTLEENPQPITFEVAKAIMSLGTLDIQHFLLISSSEPLLIRQQVLTVNMNSLWIT